MIVEVTGIGQPNKGPELMLCAVSENVLQNCGEEIGYQALVQYGSIQRATLGWKGVELGAPLGNIAPSRLPRTYGVVAEKEIDIVLDVSGLVCKDTLGPDTTCDQRLPVRLKNRRSEVLL